MSSKREQDRRKQKLPLHMQAYYEWTSGKRPRPVWTLSLKSLSVLVRSVPTSKRSYHMKSQTSV